MLLTEIGSAHARLEDFLDIQDKRKDQLVVAIYKPPSKKKLVTLNITWCLLEVRADSDKGEVLNPWSVGWFISRKVLPLCY